MRIEIETALQRDVRLIPVLLDGARIPRPRTSRLPYVHWFNVTQSASDFSFRADVELLIAAISRRYETAQFDLAGARDPAVEKALSRRDAGDVPKSPPAPFSANISLTATGGGAPPRAASSGPARAFAATPALCSRRRRARSRGLRRCGQHDTDRAAAKWPRQRPDSPLEHPEQRRQCPECLKRTGDITCCRAKRAAAAHRPHQLGEHSHDHGTGRAPGRGLRQRRQHSAGMGSRHRRTGRHPFTGHTLGVNAVTTAQLDGHRWWFPAAPPPCACGTWSLGDRSTPRSPATRLLFLRWQPRSWTAARWWYPAVRRHGAGVGFATAKPVGSPSLTAAA